MSSPEHARLFGSAILVAGREVRLARSGDLPGVMDLRGRAFRQGVEDVDIHDACSLHLWVGPEAAPGAPPQASLRLRLHPDGAALLTGYCAQTYDLTALSHQPGAVLELGRLCTEPGSADPDLLRLIWAGVARLVLRGGVARLVGCVSFAGSDPAPLTPALAFLAAHHLGPAATRPAPRARQVVPFAALAADARPQGAALVPPLLRAYLTLGGWVSDHLVIDADLNTCHVFTCVEVATLPEARRRTLNALAQDSANPLAAGDQTR